MKTLAKSLFLIFMILISGCASQEVENDEKVKITTMNFPQYDFARQLALDLGDVQMLMPPGGESHTYEPSPQDILKIQKSDIFIYTGGESDVWVDEILKTLGNSDMRVIKLMDAVEPLEIEGEHQHEATKYDEHVWTSPKNAMKIAIKICDELKATDEKNADSYQNNLNDYIEKLQELDKKYDEGTKSAKRNTLVFGDRFPFLYLARDYGLEFLSAFPGCAEETEPDVKTVKELIDKVNAENIPIVFYIEFSNQKLCDAICKETGAKKALLHSAHSVTKKEMENGITYIDIMNKNLANIKEALN